MCRVHVCRGEASVICATVQVDLNANSYQVEMLEGQGFVVLWGAQHARHAKLGTRNVLSSFHNPMDSFLVGYWSSLVFLKREDIDAPSWRYWGPRGPLRCKQPRTKSWSYIILRPHHQVLGPLSGGCLISNSTTVISFLNLIMDLMDLIKPWTDTQSRGSAHSHLEYQALILNEETMWPNRSDPIDHDPGCNYRRIKELHSNVGVAFILLGQDRVKCFGDDILCSPVWVVGKLALIQCWG